MLLKKIVVAEDDDVIAHMVSMALGDAGFLCLRARDGEEALRLVKQHDPDLLVLDIMMPRVDGLEVASRLKADVMWSRIPILMLTALSSVDNQVKGLDAGADAYMGKPFDLREFGARVRAMVRSARRERDRNPSSNLPGSRAIDQAIEDALARARKSAVPSVVLHVDVLNFDAYADAVGISRSEQAGRKLAELLLSTARADAGDGSFVGHIGGSDFVVVIPDAERGNEFATKLIGAFDSNNATFFTADDGPATVALRMVIASALTEDVPGNSAEAADELGRRLGKAMKVAKAVGHSNHVIWRPEAPPHAV